MPWKRCAVLNDALDLGSAGKQNLGEDRRRSEARDEALPRRDRQSSDEALRVRSGAQPRALVGEVPRLRHHFLH